MSSGTRRVPMGDSASDNEFRQRRFTGGATGAETTHHTDELVEYSWSGKYITMRAVGGDLYFAFSRNASAEVDRTVVATESGGPTAKIGGVLLSGEERDYQLPQFSVTQKLYFSRESSAVGTSVYMGLSDDKQVLT